MKPIIALQFKYKHPWMTWGQCWSAAGPEWIDVDWDQAFYGLMIVIMLLFVVGALFRDDTEWFCSRAKYAVAEAAGKEVPAILCIEETHRKTGKARETAR